ncbi:hypothetical protein [Culicoidibacter larvae]|uniref:Uncharacterized protein n=1 Tax=Culicoidibacter larvae TaxID=2579976 RepID=A0A5R8QD90_9FIRM|nr:hypothetical protein [Culicoidibacter larvae]TLG74250.1 hypothetical protein FEZ08_05965 [Culicoidibacter larvae]
MKKIILIMSSLVVLAIVGFIGYPWFDKEYGKHCEPYVEGRISDLKQNGEMLYFKVDDEIYFATKDDLVKQVKANDGNSLKLQYIKETGEICNI